jgi:hypothetical protein
MLAFYAPNEKKKKKKKKKAFYGFCSLQIFFFFRKVHFTLFIYLRIDNLTPNI